MAAVASVAAVASSAADTLTDPGGCIVVSYSSEATSSTSTAASSTAAGNDIAVAATASCAAVASFTAVATFAVVAGRPFAIDAARLSFAARKPSAVVGSFAAAGRLHSASAAVKPATVGRQATTADIGKDCMTFLYINS